MDIQARAPRQRRLANRFSAQADADVAALRVAPATPRAVSAASACRQAAHAPMSPAHHQPPPDRRSAAVQALRSFDGVAVSPPCSPPSGHCTPGARAARAPSTTAPREDAPTPPQAHIAPHHPPTPHASHAHQPPPAHVTTTSSPLRASPMRPMCVCLRSHGMSNPSGTSLACPTLTQRSRRAACDAKRCEHTMRVPPSHIRTPEPRRLPGGPRRTLSRRAGSATPPRS
jgi:hypothetical protein